jgi:CRISPR-associated protein Csd2
MNSGTNMTTLQHKIDFAVVFSVKNANPNGDPLNGNRPRTDYAGLGEVTDVCIKRKVRDRMVERFVELQSTGAGEGQAVFVQSDDRKVDEAKSLRDRADSLLKGKHSPSDIAKLACQTWLDVRAFGQLFAFAAGKKGKGKSDGNGDGDTGVSIGIRGPVTVQSAFSIEPVSVTSTQITKSVSGDGDGSKRGSDTMGMKHRVDHGIYVFYGSMSPQLAERTGFGDADAATIKAILPRLFENDASSARPDGTMQVLNVYWWQHNCKAGQYSSARVHQSLQVAADGSATVSELPNLKPERIPGF